jgi:hypothetical protein
MVASQAAMQERPETVALEMAASMEEHASAGDWERVEELAVRIRGVVMQVPENQRRDVILAVRRRLQQVNTIAEKHRGDVAERLSVIRRGRHAARAYANAD